MDFGVESLGVQLPKYALDVTTLAALHRVNPEKFTLGLGCQRMALCLEDQTVVDLAVGAANRALQGWEGDPKTIGFLAVGTETALDEARPLSAWIAEALGLSGSIRSYEVKHACYGGMLALRQALEWHLSGVARPGQVALVIAADVCLYPFLHPAEPTQGAGAVALLVGEPILCGLSRESFCYSEPIYDFWRPVGQLFPHIQGKQSVEAYCKALYHCVTSFLEKHSREEFMHFDRLCCHIPFPRMVTKAISFLAQKLNFSAAETEAFLQKIALDFSWSQEIGNAYTASLWISFAKALAELERGKTLGLFAYGSGCGAEFMHAVVTHGGSTPWIDHVAQDFRNREIISLQRYQDFRAKLDVCGS